MDNMTLSDIAAVMPKNTTDHDGFLEGNGIIILILFFLIFGFGGWGNNGNGNLSADMQRGFDTQSIISKLDGLSSGLCDTAYENARLIEQNTVTNMQGFNQTQMGMMQGFNGVQESINNLSHQMEQCCCNLKTQMMQDKYDALDRDYQQALGAITNATQTQNILSSLGRYVTNPPCYGGYGYGNFYGCPGATLQ